MSKEKGDRNKFFRIPALHFRTEKERDILKRIGFVIKVGEKFPDSFPHDQVNKFVELAYELGRKEGREGVIRLNKQDIKNILSWAGLVKARAEGVGVPFEEDEEVTLKKLKEWELFKNGKRS